MADCVSLGTLSSSSVRLPIYDSYCCCMGDYETFQYVAKLLILSRNGFLPSKWNLISKSNSGL